MLTFLFHTTGTTRGYPEISNTSATITLKAMKMGQTNDACDVIIRLPHAIDFYTRSVVQSVLDQSFFCFNIIICHFYFHNKNIW